MPDIQVLCKNRKAKTFLSELFYILQCSNIDHHAHLGECSESTIYHAYIICYYYYNHHYCNKLV